MEEISGIKLNLLKTNLPMKKLNLLFLTLALNLNFFAQQQQEPIFSTESDESMCGTKVPSKEWDEWFNKKVEERKLALQSGKAMLVNYQIPVIVHVIHFGQAVGTYPNISNAQILSQINALNLDFAGTGYNYTNCPAPFVPLIANTGVQFCMALSDPAGSLIPVPGIERINAAGNGWTDPATLSSPTQITNLFDNTIKPATIWDPTKYFNIWISAKAQDPGLLGYSTFPVGTSLTGIPGGFTGSATTDGVWVYAKTFGQLNGTLYANYDKGKVLVHEAGHWLGLRHMWGDGNCLTDYCNDTPWHKAATNSPNACPVTPYLANECGPGQSPDGRMWMNYMDYTDDDCMYMFTPDQVARIQTAMSQGTYRNLLGTHGLCTGGGTPTPGPAVASFTFNQTPCVGSVISPSNTSTGGPTPSYTWIIFPGGSFNPNANAASPGITFPAPGNYTLTLIASNSVATSSYSMSLFSVTTCPKPAVCLDTLEGIIKTDTLFAYGAPSSSFVTACTGNARGHLTGTNCYKDKEFAQFYPQNTYSDTPLPQVNSLIVLFDKNATKCTPTTSATQVYFRIYGGTPQNGPGAMLGQYSDSIGAIVASVNATNTIKYVGQPNYVFPSARIIPWSVNFTTPIIIPTSGFFGSVETPQTSMVDTIRIFSNTKTHSSNDSSAWVLLQANNWRTLRSARAAKVQLGILAQVTCRPIVGLKEETVFTSNINVMPNPSNGEMSLVFTLPKPDNIKIRIYNYVGQLMGTDEYQNVSRQVFDIDLSSKAPGIYFIEISNSANEKTVKKIVIQH
jgi:hypothetical protein